MKPDISEFSFGFAITEQLVHQLPGITASPVFPSLYQEGQSGGGYDVMIESGGVPLFIQFKLSDFMVRNTAAEVRDGILPVPFYRMHLRPSRHSDQHELLLRLERSGRLVYYAAPMFHETQELNLAFLSRQSVQRSVWIRPHQIGRIRDNGDHHVSFNSVDVAYLCSEPRRIKESVSAESMINRLITEAAEVNVGATEILLNAIEECNSLLESFPLETSTPEVDPVIRTRGIDGIAWLIW